jgi:transcriptional regulator with XRE-family HTH domain
MKDARLRRHFSSETVAARAGINRQTLAKIESGADSVAMGNYFQVLVVLGLDKDVNSVARDDVLGRRLQDAELPQRQRAPRTVSPAKNRVQRSSIAAKEGEPEPNAGDVPSNDKKRDK